MYLFGKQFPKLLLIKLLSEQIPKNTNNWNCQKQVPIVSAICFAKAVFQNSKQTDILTSFSKKVLNFFCLSKKTSKKKKKTG